MGVGVAVGIGVGVEVGVNDCVGLGVGIGLGGDVASGWVHPINKAIIRISRPDHNSARLIMRESCTYRSGGREPTISEWVTYCQVVWIKAI